MEIANRILNGIDQLNHDVNSATTDAMTISVIATFAILIFFTVIARRR